MEQSPPPKQVPPPEKGVTELPPIKSEKPKKQPKAPNPPQVIKDSPNHITIK